MATANEAPARGRPEPRATYRVQLTPGFTFADLERRAGYLAVLGVSHAYLSPILEATPGSTHGYDVVDHRRVRAELGGEEGYRRLGATLGERGLGQVLDIVPNHMAIGPLNPWWWDVLENGAASRYATFFDVEWQHHEPTLRDRILLPVLGDHYGRVLEAGDLRLEWDGTRFSLRYGDDRYPLAPRSLDGLVRAAADRAGSDELAWLADALAALPPSTATDPESVERRHRDKEVIARRLAELARDDTSVAEAIEAAVATVASDPDALDRLLERQNYRLAWWRTARRDLGYRRFFDVTGLAGLRTEDDRVFAATHARVLAWLADGVLDGVRVDHPDGLRDPEGYLRRLRGASPRGWIVVEKVLEPGEELRRSWPVDGTTGYEFLNRVQGLLLDPAGEAPLTALWEELSGDPRPWPAVAAAAKADVLRDVLGSELGRLTALLLDVLEGHRRHRDHTRHDLHEALAALLVAFPVYRTYVEATPTEEGRPPRVTPEDEAAIRAAVAGAKELRPDLPADLFDVVGELLLLRLGTGDLERELVARFQQLSGPVMAKGIEDTAFYRYHRLAALNEVGGDPGRWGTDVDAFHAAEAAVAERWGATMLATTTHDTKRSEDVRARLLVLAEIPDRWRKAVTRWIAMTERHRTDDLPDRATQYLILQTVVGAWPLDADRLTTYVRKAIREAKDRTSWTEPNEAYETAVLDYASAILEDDAFRDDVEVFVRSILRPGRVNGLAQTLVKLTAPGVPDLYQGSELWALDLVDPDNRRPVDYDLRERLLREVDGCRAEELEARLDDPTEPGLPKLALVRRTLGVRARQPDAFGREARYTPLLASGNAADHVVAFERGDRAVTVVPRLPVGLAGSGWGETSLDLPPGRWRDAVSGAVRAGGPAPVGDLLTAFPVALLEREDG